MRKRLIIKKVNNIFGNYWLVKNNRKEILGTFSYDKEWKCMTWKQAEDIQMSDCCLDELSLAMKRRLKHIR